MPAKAASSAKTKKSKGKGKGKSKAAPKKKASRARVSKPKQVNGESGGQTLSAFSRSVKTDKVRRSLPKLGAPSFYQVTTSNSLANASIPFSPASGRQCPMILGQWNSLADIYSMSSNVPKIATIAGDTPTRFHLHSLKGVITMNNPTSNTMVVELYDIVARMDVPTAAATGAPLTMSTPTSAWALSQVQQANSAIPYAAPTQLGAEPTDGQLFNDYYRVLGRKTIVLPQNATHVHTVNIKAKRDFDLGEMAVQQAYLAAFRDVTHYTMAVVRGQPCLDTESMTTTTITPYLRWVVSEHYQYQWVQANGSLSTFSNAIANGAVTEKCIQLNNPVAGPVVAT